MGIPRYRTCNGTNGEHRERYWSGKKSSDVNDGRKRLCSITTVQDASANECEYGYEYRCEYGYKHE